MSLTKAHNRMIAGAAINVMDYGAVGDGVADDTDAIKAALEAANTASPRKDVYIPAGTYKVTDTIYQTYPDEGVGFVDFADKKYGKVFGAGPLSTTINFTNTEYCWVVGAIDAYASTTPNKQGVYSIGLSNLQIRADDNLCEHGLWIGGCHWGVFEEVHVNNFITSCITLYANYGAGGVGSLWNTMYSCHAGGNGTIQTTTGLHVTTGANACTFIKPWADVCKIGILNEAGRTVFVSPSMQTRSAFSDYGFGVSGQCTVFGLEMESVGGGSTPIGINILKNRRSDFYSPKVVGFTNHIANNSGETYPEVSVHSSTYTTNNPGPAEIFQNVRSKPIIDNILNKTRILKEEQTETLSGTTGWTNYRLWSSDDDSGGELYYGRIPARITVSRTGTSGNVEVQLRIDPSTGTFYSLGTLAAPNTTITFSFEDIMDAIVNLGYEGVVVPRLRLRNTTVSESVTTTCHYYR